MSERDDPQLLRLLRDHGVPFVVIGGWAVINHGYVRFTKDIDVLVPDRLEVHAAVAAALASVGAQRRDGRAVRLTERIPEQGWQVETQLGRIDVLLEGIAPLDFASVEAGALDSEMEGVPFRFAGLATIVAFKRLAGRPQDRADLEELEAIHGPLPIVPVPGLDE